MALVLTTITMFGALGEIVIVDSPTERMDRLFRMPPKWWEWHYSPDGWMIGKWRWVRFNAPHPASVKNAPDPAKFNAVAETDGLVTIDGGQHFCMALYYRKPPDMNWGLYALLAAASWTGEQIAVETQEPNINLPWPMYSSVQTSMSNYNFGWGYFGQATDFGHRPHAPVGKMDFNWHAEKYTDNFKFTDYFRDFIFDSGPGPSPKGPPASQAMGRTRPW